MKQKIKNIAIQLWVAVLQNPMEVLLSFVFCVLACMQYEWMEKWPEDLVGYFPVCFLLTYSLNQLTVQWKKLRFLYYSIVWFLFLFLFLYGVEEIGSFKYGVTIIIAQLIYFISLWELDNDIFASKVLSFLRALLFAFLLSCIACLLSVSIFYSIQYIFDIWHIYESLFINCLGSIAFVLMLPLLFLMFNQGKEKQGISDNKLFYVLLNYVLSPALLIYGAILYLYFIKIIVLWSLPKGDVAYIVVCFVTAAFVLKGCQSFFKYRCYNWFYNRVSWFVIPSLIMYWVCVIYRVNQYGFTEARVYLVIVGIILTITTVFFFFRILGHYLYICCIAVCLLLVVTYIPGITAKDIERRSQINRDNYFDKKGAKMTIYIENIVPIDVSGYQTMRFVTSYRNRDRESSMWLNKTSRDTLELYNEDDSILFKMKMDDFFEQKLAEVGVSKYDSIPVEAYPSLLRIELDSAVLILDEIALSKDSVYKVIYVLPGVYLK